ncbi:MAG: DUF3440 domain-containing protein [Lactococcus petauri]
MSKKYLQVNVYEAFKHRITYIFEHFDHIILSFSGGKDSGLMVELVHEFYEKSNYQGKISVFYLDYEGNYEKTKEYVNRCMGKYQEFDYYHVCLPVSASCGVSMDDSTWLPWNPKQEDIWVGTIPKESIHLKNHNLPFFEIGMSDYDFQTKFCQWLHEKSTAKRTAVLVGIRAQESLNRYTAVTRKDTFSKFGTIAHSRRIAHNVFNFYPLYDWLFEDVWKAIGEFGFDYNQLYDLFFQAKVPYRYMKVANPFHQCGVQSLMLYKSIEPETWGKLLGRVNGANFASLYGSSTAFGYRGITLPEGHTWKTYVNFLLSTLPVETRKIYLKKFKSSKKYWTQKGGALPVEIINELDKIGLSFEKCGKPQNNRKYKKAHEVIRFFDYPDDIPIKNFRLIPSYKRMCITILKNDTSCLYMGFGPTKDELQLQKEVIEKWETLL